MSKKAPEVETTPALIECVADNYHFAIGDTVSKIIDDEWPGRVVARFRDTNGMEIYVVHTGTAYQHIYGRDLAHYQP